MKNKLLKQIALGLALALCLSGQLLKANQISIGRYLFVPLKPEPDQIDLLKQKVQVVFPQNIITIEQAMHFLLHFSGYQLTNKELEPFQVRQMLKQSLPEVDQHLGPMTLAQSLTTLSGKTFILLIDPVHRLIGFRLKNKFKPLYLRIKPKRITK